MRGDVRAPLERCAAKRTATLVRRHSPAEGAPIFRVRNRTVVDGDAEPRVQRDEVTFVAPMRVLFWKAWAATTVAQRADVSAGDERVTVDFNLLHSVSSPYRDDVAALRRVDGPSHRPGRVALVQRPTCLLRSLRSDYASGR